MSDAICSGCGRTATVEDSYNGAMRCTDYPNCEFPAEPTEEQKQAAQQFTGMIGDRDALARLLAKHEAKLRSRVVELTVERDLNIRQADASWSLIKELRVRVEELEAVVAYQRTTHEADLRDSAGHEAQHILDINSLRARITELEQENKTLNSALDIYMGNDDKCDALLRSVGIDDTINVVPRLDELVKEYRKLKDATET